MTETMAKMLLAEEEAKQRAAQDAALEAELKSAKEKYGDFNETFVLGYVNAGAKLDDAVKAYQNMVNELLTNANRPQAPTVISGQAATGVPSSQINPSGLQNKDVRGLVANMMRATNQQG
jgi:DNA-binding protein H-NS